VKDLAVMKTFLSAPIPTRDPVILVQECLMMPPFFKYYITKG